VVTRGFVLVKESRGLLEKSAQVAAKAFAKHVEKGSDLGFIRSKMEKDIQGFLHKETGGSPLVVVFPVRG